VYFYGVLVNCGFYQHYYAKVLSRLLRGTRKRVLELGGGHGGMAYFLIRDNPDVTYIDFDLPENAALTAYYLLRAFPNKRVLPFGEEEDLSASIIIMPSFAITELADKSVDVAFNSYSLAEMSRETIDTFVSELMRLASEYILHVNHNRVSKVVADDFGIEGKFDLLYKIPALWNRGMDEYEYLYKAIKM
jgi:putative sugar O-methyltransferase